MDYYRNFDRLCLDRKPLVDSGIQVSFINEDYYIEPVTVEEFKDHGYIDCDTDNNLIAMYLTAARIDVENYLQKSLGARTVQIKAISLSDNFMLPWGPVAEAITDHELFGDILRKGGRDITVTYTTNATLVNDSIKNAIYKHAFNYYENRDSNQSVELDGVTKKILNPYRRVVFP